MDKRAGTRPRQGFLRTSKQAIQSAGERSRLRTVERLEPRQMLAGDTFFVDAINGDDANDGSEASPFATIQAGANAATAGDTVMIHGGVYRESVTVPRSGTVNNPIVFRPVEGSGEVVVSGADLVTGWTLAPSAGPNIWVATADWNANNDRDANTLFVNGVLSEEGRHHADTDFFNIDDWGAFGNGDLPDNSQTLTVDDLGGFADDFWNGAKIKFHVNDFAFATRTITDFDTSSGVITFDSPVGQTIQKQTNGYYIFDSLRTLDKPGEWYKEDGGDQLFYQAEPGQNPNSLDIEFKRRAFGFDVSGRDNIHIEGIEFRGISIDTDGNSDRNVFQNNRFYAYDKDDFGRFIISGDNNVFRDNEVSNTWNSFLTVAGLRNEVVNNFIHDIGYNATTRVLTAAGAEEVLISHNTVETFARSFLDGYPLRSEIAYNEFIGGGSLSWDTGVFDADGANGNGSNSIFHHNVFRDANPRGIYRAIYGRNANAVFHHNVVFNYEGTGREVIQSNEFDFRQAHHNTFITSIAGAPSNEEDAADLVQVRYNNNVQISLARTEAIGTDTRGSYNYTPSDFVDFANDNFELAPGSGAIDSGIVLPGINDDFLGDAPDAGAYEFGREAWRAGHDFVNPPTPVFDWQALPGTNLHQNGFFGEGIGDWTITSGNPNSRDRNSNSFQTSVASLTGTFRTQSVEFAPGDGISRTFTGLKPSTTYTVGVAARSAQQLVDADQFDDSFGSVRTSQHRGEDYVTGIGAGEWVRYDNVDFGDPGQFDQLDYLVIRGDADSGFTLSLDGAGIEIRLDSPTGPLLVDVDEVIDGRQLDRWRAEGVPFQQPVSGVHSIYISTTGANGTNLGLGSLRLSKENTPDRDRLTTTIASPGAPNVTSFVGGEFWERFNDEIIFTTGPTATTASVSFVNNGRINSYLDRLYLIEGFATRGAAEPRDISTGRPAEASQGTTGGTDAPALTDGDLSTIASTDDTPGSWLQVDLGKSEPIHSIVLTAPGFVPARASNFRVTVYSTDPRQGGVALWNQDYLVDGQTLDAGEQLFIYGKEIGLDGETRLENVAGRFVRVQLLGTNVAGNHQLALSELQVLGFNRANLAASDGRATQSSTDSGLVAGNANDGDASTRSATDPNDVNSWWQFRLPQPVSIGEIELVNHDGADFAELSNFTVSIWDEDPAAGGSQVWQQSYFGTGSVGRGESFTLTGDEIGADGFTRLASLHTGRVVRVQLNGTNNVGNGRLSLEEVRVLSSENAPPATNLAQSGVASQRNDFYGDSAARGTNFGFADVATDGVISNTINFTSALNEPNGWWQVDLGQDSPIEQIVLYNRAGNVASRLDDFFVQVWDGDPDNGGSLLWDRFYQYSGSAPTYSTGTTIGDGGALIIEGSDTDSGLRLDQVTGARYVRVQLTDSDILSLPEVQVWGRSSEVALDQTQTRFDFDFGSSSSPVPNGWTGVVPNAYGDASWFGRPDSVYQPTAPNNDINRDFATSVDEATFRAQVPEGVYNVLINMGDAFASRDNVVVWVEGQQIAADIDLPAGQYSYIDQNGASATPTSFQVEVRDGVFELRLDDTADESGAAAGWALNRLTLTRVADLPPGPDNALQLLVDASGRAVLRNTTGDDLTLEGYEITDAGAGLSPTGWFSLEDQRAAGEAWSETVATSGTLAESGAPITIPFGGSIYLGQVSSGSTIDDIGLSYLLSDDSVARQGFVALQQLALPALDGDYNGDSRVDAADYSVWRDAFGDSGLAFAGVDGNGSGIADQGDYELWRRNYGAEVTSTTLIQGDTGNGSFEDWGPLDSESRVIGNNATLTIPGWNATTTGIGGWLRQGDPASTAGAASDGISYALGTGDATVVLTSDPLTSHQTATGEQFTVSLDAGSSDGSVNSYQVTLIFGGTERTVATFFEGSNATTEGLANHEFSYTATAADAGHAPVLRITSQTAGSFSRSFVDNVVFEVGGGSTIVVTEGASALSSATVPASAVTSSTQRIASQVADLSTLSLVEPSATAVGPGGVVVVPQTGEEDTAIDAAIQSLEVSFSEDDQEELLILLSENLAADPDEAPVIGEPASEDPLPDGSEEGHDAPLANAL